MKLDVWISTLAPLTAQIAPPYKLYVPRRELERKFEIVFSVETANSLMLLTRAEAWLLSNMLS
jgi:hypothetical protein